MVLRCAGQYPGVTTNVWNAWVCHTGTISRHWSALDSIWMSYGGEKETINRLPLAVASGLPTVQVHHTFDYCPPQWPSEGRHHPRPVVVMFELYHRGTNLPT
ncbi:hypothetical protein TNCV_728071 [Trichonephila clavipes]|nr:hypothetical protein TNCV_728071 [Trichonephila clavipes]